MLSRAVHYRTEYCKFYKIGECSRGTSCAFAHSSNDVNPKVDLLKTQLCHSFSAGSCLRGSRCKFAHGEEELQPLDMSVVPRMPESQLKKEEQKSAVEWLEGGTATGEMAMGFQSVESGKSKLQGMATPRPSRGSGKKTAAGYLHEPPPGMEAIALVTQSEKIGNCGAVLEQQALETRSQISVGATKSLLNGSTDIQSLRFRTSLCKFYFAGKCSRGEDCTFAHSKEQLLPLVDLRKGSLCFDFEFRGCCDNGDSCKFAHGKSDLRQPSLIRAPEQNPIPMPKQLRVSASVLHPDEHMPESITDPLLSHRLEDLASFQCFGTMRL